MFGFEYLPFNNSKTLVSAKRRDKGYYYSVLLDMLPFLKRLRKKITLVSPLTPHNLQS